MRKDSTECGRLGKYMCLNHTDCRAWVQLYPRKGRLKHLELSWPYFLFDSLRRYYSDLTISSYSQENSLSGHVKRLYMTSILTIIWSWKIDTNVCRNIEGPRKHSLSGYLLSIVNIKCHRNFVQNRIIYRMLSRLPGSVEKRSGGPVFSIYKIALFGFLGCFYL